MNGISYIITTYNRNRLLERAIQSIIAERFLPSELIVVDDCGSQEISFSRQVKAVWGKDIHLIHNTQNLGVIGARNVGIMATKYDFLLFLDDDDESFPNRSKDLFAHISESDYAFVAAKCEMRLPSYLKIVPNTPEIILNTRSLMLFPAHINGIIWQKAALLSLNGMDNRVPYFGEHITMHLFLLKGKKALQVEEIVAHFSYLKNGLTQNTTQRNAMKEQLLAFSEVLTAESQNTPSHNYFVQINQLLPYQNITTFDDYLSFVSTLIEEKA